MMQVVGPTLMNKPRIVREDDGDYCCAIPGASFMCFASTPEDAYNGWREEMVMEHRKHYAHDPDHKLYFPGDPEWAAEMALWESAR